jgi:hypothetical protein
MPGLKHSELAKVYSKSSLWHLLAIGVKLVGGERIRVNRQDALWGNCSCERPSVGLLLEAASVASLRS